MNVEIDKYAGFCFGVTNAIMSAEDAVADKDGIYCLGEIVHNAKEEERLINLGMKTIEHGDIAKITGQRMLIRAHGEPPQTYKIAKEYNVEIIDATCPVVLKLQQRIKEKHETGDQSQIVIFGKKGHAEVNGLVGQTKGKAIVISNLEEAKEIDLTKKTYLFSQTTSNHFEYDIIGEYLVKQAKLVNQDSENLVIYQSICPSVKNRIPRLIEFCSKHEVILFVSDSNSSNGKMLYEVCLQNNSNTFFITGVEDICKQWFNEKKTVGISGATSTPLWLMEKIKQEIISY